MTRKRDRRQRVEPEHADLEHLRSGVDRLPARQRAAVRDADDGRERGLGDVVHAEQLGQLDSGADLLAALPDRGAGGILIVIDEAAGQAPVAVTGLDRSPAEDDPAVGFDHHSGRHLGVAPEDEVVVRARLELAAFDDAEDERRPALDAVMAQRGRA
jgi:hypothetical protein